MAYSNWWREGKWFVMYVCVGGREGGSNFFLRHIPHTTLYHSLHNRNILLNVGSSSEIWILKYIHVPVHSVSLTVSKSVLIEA